MTTTPLQIERACQEGTAEAVTILRAFYPEENPFWQLLLKHSTQVRDKALAILAASHGAVEADARLVAKGAMLHDIGIGRCRAPGILCYGAEDYMAHGVVGAGMLREYAAEHAVDLEACARICERHTGSGLTAEEVRAEKLPIPVRDYLPVTPAERLVCLADKFYSKSGAMAEKSLERLRSEMARFGEAPLRRLDEMIGEFLPGRG